MAEYASAWVVVFPQCCDAPPFVAQYVFGAAGDLPFRLVYDGRLSEAVVPAKPRDDASSGLSVARMEP